METTEEAPTRRRGRKSREEQLVETDTKVTVWASLGMTVNLGNYENQKIDIGVSGLPVDASDEFIALQLNKAKLTLNKAVEGLADEMRRRITEDYGR
jgi:hypothetical protein